MEKAGTVANRLQRNAMQTSTDTSTEKSRALPENWVAAIFKKLAINYGNLWTSQFSTQAQTDAALEEWGIQLADVSPEQIKQALSALPDKPPSLPEFRKACLPDVSGLTHNTAAYKFFRKALPKPKADPEIVKAELAKMRKA